MQAQNGYEPYAGIIDRGLSQRRAQGACARNPQYSAPQYVVDMCEALATAINERGGLDVTVHAVVTLEGTCTGTDYHHKLAMRCQRLALNQPA